MKAHKPASLSVAAGIDIRTAVVATGGQKHANNVPYNGIVDPEPPQDTLHMSRRKHTYSYNQSFLDSVACAASNARLQQCRY
jgi:hypothetical protein